LHANEALVLAFTDQIPRKWHLLQLILSSCLINLVFILDITGLSGSATPPQRRLISKTHLFWLR